MMEMTPKYRLRSVREDKQQFQQRRYYKIQGFSYNFGKKLTNLKSKLGKINDIEHNKGNKIYPQNQVILGCIMPSIPLMHKCLSIILIWVIVSHK